MSDTQIPTNLPIYEVIESLESQLTLESCVVLQAPPGAGKSTRVPLALLDALWLERKKILMLEPRRVAARMVATQMANLLGEHVGERVGYRVKDDTKESQDTKILVVTEAILVRMLQSDQTLSSVGLIIFDEFHERSIYSDLALALSLEVQSLLREDLKLLIMSATLQSEKVAAFLDNAPVITSKGRTYPIEYSYLDPKKPHPKKEQLNSYLIALVKQSLKEDSGDILLFLPGSREIERVKKELQEQIHEKDIEIVPLYGTLSKSQQDRAILPSKKRKVILSTNIAQTSLTIEGVRVVIDSGLEKLSSYNYANGMDYLGVHFISKESATQRAGRAGRIAAGKCYRVWHESRILQEQTPAEIMRADLASLVLDLALWGVECMDELQWLDIPEVSRVTETKVLLQELEMLDSSYKITPFGEDALTLGLHPRLAYMILKAAKMGFAYEASLLAAQLNSGEIFHTTQRDSDLRSRFMHLYERDLERSFINRVRAKEILREAENFYKRLKRVTKVGVSQEPFGEEILALLLLMAYPDRLALQRGAGSNRYKMSNGKGALLAFEESLLNEPYLVVARVSAKERDSMIQLALPISIEMIEKEFTRYIKSVESVKYNRENQKFEIREEYFFLEAKLDSKPIEWSEKYSMSELLMSAIREEGLSLLEWSKRAKQLQDRVLFVISESSYTLKDFSDRGLLDSLEIWLAPYLEGIKSAKALKNIDIYSALLGVLSWEEQQLLHRVAPERIEVPSGSKIAIDYSDSKKPALRVKIQEMFGLLETPKILDNSYALQIFLLSPAMRPIQITYDLKSFWENSYSEVRKELRGKYKRHYWPENPYEAIATKKSNKKQLSAIMSS